jgi:hypothetical protein
VSLHVVLVSVRAGEEPEAAHTRAVARTREALPNLRFVASYRTQGSVDFVDVLELDDEREDPGEVAALLGGDGALSAELLPAQASALLRAPGSAPPP